MPETKRPLKVFLCHAHIIPLRDSDQARAPQGDDMRDLYNRLTKPS
jgi:diadenosine tetraphosphate (Ap4A) HIT family hydrolase